MDQVCTLWSPHFLPWALQACCDKEHCHTPHHVVHGQPSRKIAEHVLHPSFGCFSIECTTYTCHMDNLDSRDGTNYMNLFALWCKPDNHCPFPFRCPVVAVPTKEVHICLILPNDLFFKTHVLSDSNNKLLAQFLVGVRVHCCRHSMGLLQGYQMSYKMVCTVEALRAMPKCHWEKSACWTKVRAGSFSTSSHRALTWSSLSFFFFPPLGNGLSFWEIQV